MILYQLEEESFDFNLLHCSYQKNEAKHHDLRGKILLICKWQRIINGFGLMPAASIQGSRELQNVAVLIKKGDMTYF